MRLFKSTNKSQASLEPNTDTRDGSPTHPNNSNSDTAYSQTQKQQYGGSSYAALLAAAQQEQKHQHQQQQLPQPPPPSKPYPHQHQHQQQHQHHPPPQQQQLDERYYAENQQPTHPAHLLSRSSSHRIPPSSGDPYAQQRPSVSIVPPSQAHGTIHENSQPHQPAPNQTQFGDSHRPRPGGEKEHKKSKRSIFGLGTSKDKNQGRDNSPERDRSRLSRTSSVLKRGGSHQNPQSPTVPQKGDSRSESISAYLEQSAAHNHNHNNNNPTLHSPVDNYTDVSSSENLPEDPAHYEQYYRHPDQQYDSPSSQYTRKSVQYLEDAPHFPPPPQSYGTYQQHPNHSPLYQHQPQQVYPGQHSDTESEQTKHFFPYPGQPVRPERSAVFEADSSLRPPSQSSLGPPSPVVGGPTSSISRPGTSNTQPRLSSQSWAVPQQSNHSEEPLHLSQALAQTSPAESGPASANTNSSVEMGRGERDRHQRESRLDEIDARYQDQRARMPAMPSTTHDQGRSTPPPRTREDITTLDHQQLLARYEELQAKYSKVKRYYFEREAQVTQLQNTVATQRLSMSKTSLDDAQYATRFERLNGAIQNLAFNIRKDWRRIPNWLAPACNRDACQVGTKEMTAVGRACISRWLFEKIFQEIFHPGIDPVLSSQLKNMERNLRRTPTNVLTEDQRDDLLTKVTTWRLSTCEGLQDILNSRHNEAYTDTLGRQLTQQLGDYLKTSLNDPPPPGLDDNLLTIVGQTLSIAANLPLESRDICIDYFFPGMPISDMYMKIESGMTPLQNPGSAPSREDPGPPDEDADDERMSNTSERDEGANVEDQIREASAKAAAAGSQQSMPTRQESLQSSASLKHPHDKRQEKKSGGMFGSFGGSFVSKKPAPTANRGDAAHGGGNNNRDSVLMKSDHAKDDQQVWNLETLTRGNKDGKIRFAVFLVVEVRGKSEKKDPGQSQTSTNGSGGDLQSQQQQQQQQQQQGKAASAGIGATASSAGVGTMSGGTSGAAGQGGVNVLVKAPVYSF